MPEISLIKLPKETELRNFYSILNNEIIFSNYVPPPQENVEFSIDF